MVLPVIDVLLLPWDLRKVVVEVRVEALIDILMIT
jgi:hypothetical protein